MLSIHEYNTIIKFLQNSNMTDKQKIHIVGELKRITNFSKKKILY